MQEQQQHILTYNQISQLSLEELVQSWQTAVPQFMHAAPIDALKVVNQFLAALPVTLRYNEHFFFVQHIFLSKAALYHRSSTLANEHSKEQGCPSMPINISLKAEQHLNLAKHFLGIVNPELLTSASMDPHICSSALHTYKDLKDLLTKQDDDRIAEQLKQQTRKRTFISIAAKK